MRIIPPHMKPYAAGYSLGAALGAIRDLMKQKAETYDPKKGGKPINPYRMARSAILGGVLGTALVHGGKMLARSGKTLDEAGKTMSAARDTMGRIDAVADNLKDVTNKAKTKRFFGLFARR